MPNIETKTSIRAGRVSSFFRWLAIGCSTCLVTCHARPSGRAVDRSTLNRGAHPTPLAGLDSPHSVSQTLPIHSTQPNLAPSSARRSRGGGRSLLPTPWIRLARGSNRRRGRFGRRPHSRGFHPDAATCEEPVLRDGPFCIPQGCGVHTGAGGRVRPRQTAHSGDISQRSRMGPWYLWCRVGVSLPRRNCCTECWPGTSSAARRDSPGSFEATARAHE